MDEMRIGSKFMNNIITKIIRKVIKKKFGGDLVVEFLDPIEVVFDDDSGIVDAHIHANVHMRKETIQSMLQNLV